MAVQAPPLETSYWQQLRVKQGGALVLNYRALRNSIGFIGFGLAIVLFVGAKLISGQWPQSVSGYYFSPVRNVLVGALCTVSIFLMAYSGYNNLDRWVTNIAGICALGVAFFPTANPAFHPHWISYFHHFFSTLMLIFLALMSLQFTRTESTNVGDLKDQLSWLWHAFWRRQASSVPSGAGALNKTPDSPAHGASEAGRAPASAAGEVDEPQRMMMKRRRNRVYVWCARLIIVWILCAGVQNFVNAPSLHLFFWCEVLALWTFSVAWLTKGQILRKQEA
jgi:hypothetical protein